MPYDQWSANDAQSEVITENVRKSEERMRNKYEPGPWEYEFDGNHAYIRRGKPADWNCATIAECTIYRESTEATARLIAAAPELLSLAEFALRDVQSRLYMLAVDDHEQRTILITQSAYYQEVIRKAKGE